MSDLQAAHAYLFDRWVEEDNDGINMIIMDARRNSIEAEFESRFTTLEPELVDEYGNRMYRKAVLDNVWLDVSAKHPIQ